MGYEAPNNSNVDVHDFIVIPEDGSYLRLPVTGKANSGLSAITFYKTPKGEEISGTYPYSTSIIQKEDGRILVGEKVVIDRELRGLLKTLAQK